MPTCTEFEVIDQYLSLRDQIDLEDPPYTLMADHKLPQFLTPSMEGSEPEPLNGFAAMEGDTATTPWMANFLFQGNEPQPVVSSPQQRSLTTTYVAGAAGSGCTMIDASSPMGFSDHSAPSPELYDLDGDKNCSRTLDGGVIKPPHIKMENLHHLDSLTDDLARGSGGAAEGCMFAEDREDLTTYMIQSLKEDIIRDCKQLNISPDPTKWRAADTMKWIYNELHKDQSGNGLPYVHPSEMGGLDVFSVPGEVLCQMTLDHFQYCSPLGTFLHQKLEIWRTAMDITSEPPRTQSYTTPQPPPPPHSSSHPHHHHNHHNHNHNHQSADPLHPNHHHHHHYPHQYDNHPSSARGMPQMVSEYCGGTPHMIPRLSPAPSPDSLCSSSSSLSSSSSSMGGRGGGGEGTVIPPSSAGFGVRYESAFPHGPTQSKSLPSHVMNHPTPPHLSSPAHLNTPSHLNMNTSSHLNSSSRMNTPAHLTTPSRLNAPPHLSNPQRGPRHGKQTIHLWQFLRELLDDADSFQHCIKWVDRVRGVFKIEDSSKVAKLWGRRKNRPAMNYDKLSRSVRQYYKKGIIKKTEHSKRLVYQFCQPYL